MIRRLSWFSFFAFCALAWAQTDQTGAIRGTVVDDAGQPIPGASIASSLPDGSYPKTVFSDENGAFAIFGMKPGAYNLDVTMAGFAPSKRTGVRVSAQQTVTLEIELGVEAVAQVMTVTATQQLIDTSTTEYATSIDEELTEKLPVSRTATDLVALTPGARSEQQLWGGSTDQANNFQLDGVTVNSPGYGGSFLLPNVNWIKEFQVKGLGAGAEYGNFQGGLVNIVTRSGSNTFEGDVYTYYESDSLNDSNLVPAEEGFEDASYMELNANVSGAIVKDKFYYFLSAEEQTLKTKVVDIANSDREINFLDTKEDRTETKLYSKFTWQATEADTLNLAFGWDAVETDYRGLDSYTDPEATTTQDSPAYFYNFSWERPFGASHFLEVKFTGYDGANDFEPRNGDISGVRILGGNRESYRNAPYLRQRDLTSNAVAINLDSFYMLGETSHHVKIGLNYDQGSWLETRQRNGGFTWRPELGDGDFNPDDPNSWGFISSDWGGDIRLDAETLNAALYVQDYISFTEWMDVSVGARYGKWEGKATPGDGSGSQFKALSDSGISPRLGATFDLFNDDKWIAKVHWGKYYQNMFALLFDRVDGVNAFMDEEYWDWIGEGQPDLNRGYSESEREQYFEYYSSSPTSQETGPVMDYSQPYVEQVVLGLERQLNTNWKVGLTYFNRQNKDILALVDTNLETNYTAFHNVAVIDYDSGNPLISPDGGDLVLPTVYVSNDDIQYLGWAPGMTEDQIDNLTWNPNYVLTNVDEAYRDMDQFQFVLEGYSDNLSLNFSLAWSDLVGNFYSVSGYDDPSGIGAGAFVHPNEQTNFEGNLRNYAEWAAKLRLTYDIPWDVRLGVFYRWDSGDFYTPVYDIDTRNHDFYSEDFDEYFSYDHFYRVEGERIFLDPRGNREYDSFSRLDLHVDKAIRFRGDSRLLIGIDVFNALNGDSVTRIDNEVGYFTYGNVERRQDPRVMRFQLAYRW